jgi:RNA polymerase sigma-70 factor (ECF subfamily)
MLTAGSVAAREARVRALVALIRRMARGDQAALATLYDETCAAVHGLSVRIVRDESVAEDVTIDVYMQAFRDAPTYDTARSTPLAWLLTLARTRAVEQVRTESGPPASPPRPETTLAAAADPDELTLAGEPRRAVQTVVAGLDAEQRRVIELAYYGGMSQREIADALGQPLGTITTRIQQGVVALREGLGSSPAERQT